MIRLLSEKDRLVIVDYLERNHIECTFLIGNVENFGIENDKAQRRGADYYGYFEDSDLKGILPFYNLGSCIPHFESKGAVTGFINIMRDRSFTYLLGMSSFVGPLYEGLREYKKVSEYSDDSYFVNNHFKPFCLDGVEITDASKLKLDDVLSFMLEARIKGFDDKSSIEDVRKTLTQRAEDEDFIFLARDGRIAAQACIQTTTSRINQIGGVYTTETERGKGYCKAVVSELCSRIAARGKIPTLMVRKNNTPAVKAYTSLGFEYYGDYNIITFE